MTKVPVQTYSLKEIATQICGDDLKDPERWVLRCIYAGKFRAIKVGRSYRMTEEQLDEALAALEIKPTTVTSPTPPSGPVLRRRRRRS
jgi:excisionase family DNA binding protein